MNYNSIICFYKNNSILILEMTVNLFQNVLLNINQNDCGEANKYVQDSEPSCLFTSLANAMSFIGHNQLAQSQVRSCLALTFTCTKLYETVRTGPTVPAGDSSFLLTLAEDEGKRNLFLEDVVY